MKSIPRFCKSYRHSKNILEVCELKSPYLEMVPKISTKLNLMFDFYFFLFYFIIIINFFLEICTPSFLPKVLVQQTNHFVMWSFFAYFCSVNLHLKKSLYSSVNGFRVETTELRRVHVLSSLLVVTSNQNASDKKKIV